MLCPCNNLILKIMQQVTKSPLVPSVGGIRSLCFTQRDGKVHFVICLQKSLTAYLIMLDGYMDFGERFECREREF